MLCIIEFVLGIIRERAVLHPEIILLMSCEKHGIFGHGRTAIRGFASNHPKRQVYKVSSVNLVHPCGFLFLANGGGGSHVPC